MVRLSRIAGPAADDSGCAGGGREAEGSTGLLSIKIELTVLCVFFIRVVGQIPGALVSKFCLSLP